MLVVVSSTSLNPRKSTSTSSAQKSFSFHVFRYSSRSCAPFNAKAGRAELSSRQKFPEFNAAKTSRTQEISNTNTLSADRAFILSFSSHSHSYPCVSHLPSSSSSFAFLFPRTYTQLQMSPPAMAPAMGAAGKEYKRESGMARLLGSGMRVPHIWDTIY
jgi:hypothetical protein